MAQSGSDRLFIKAIPRPSIWGRFAARNETVCEVATLIPPARGKIALVCPRRRYVYAASSNVHGHRIIFMYREVLHRSVRFPVSNQHCTVCTVECLNARRTQPVLAPSTPLISLTPRKAYLVSMSVTENTPALSTSITPVLLHAISSVFVTSSVINYHESRTQHKRNDQWHRFPMFSMNIRWSASAAWWGEGRKLSREITQHGRVSFSRHVTPIN